MCVEAISVAEKLTEVGMVVVAEHVMVVEEVEGAETMWPLGRGRGIGKGYRPKRSREKITVVREVVVAKKLAVVEYVVVV